MATHRRGYNPPPASYYDNRDKKCRKCKRPLTGRKTRFCSSDCSDQFWWLRHWGSYRLHIFREDNHTCARCGFEAGRFGASLLHVDHIIPLADGGPEFYRPNLRTVCIPCHKWITKEWHKRRRSAKIAKGSKKG